MARANNVWLVGQVWGENPRITIKDGVPTKGTMMVRCMRRPTMTVTARTIQTAIDCPVISTYDPALSEIMMNLRVGDIVQIFGVLTSRNWGKAVRCPVESCKTINNWPGTLTYVTPIMIDVRQRGLDADAGLEALRKMAEISNRIIVIGQLCHDGMPITYQDAKGVNYASYQIAVGRRYHIRNDGADEQRTDFFYVKSFGKNAVEDAANLEKGKNVYVDGAIQTRIIERMTVCACCGNEIKFSEPVAEIVPSYTGYLDKKSAEAVEEEAVDAETT